MILKWGQTFTGCPYTFMFKLNHLYLIFWRSTEGLGDQGIIHI